MDYIKFRIRDTNFDSTSGVRSFAKIARIESNFTDTSIYELNTILHSLALGTGVKSNNKLAYTFPFALGELTNK